MKATVISGKIKMIGEAVVKKNTIEVSTHEFGKLIFDRATGKAKSGYAYIENFKEICDSFTPGEDEKILWNVYTDGRHSQDNHALISFVVKKEMVRKTTGMIQDIEPIKGDVRLTPGQVVEFDTKNKWGVRSGTFFDSRDDAIKHLADVVVRDACSCFDRVEKWYRGKFDHEYLGFLTHIEINLAIVRYFTPDEDAGNLSRRRRILLDDYGDMEPPITQQHLIDYIIGGKVPSIVMVEPIPEKKKGKKRR